MTDNTSIELLPDDYDSEPDYEKAYELAERLLVSHESGWCSHDGWNPTKCCTDWQPALYLDPIGPAEFREYLRLIIDRAIE